METVGVQRVRGRDLATGIVLGAATGLTALFLFLDTTQGATTGAAQTILFGSIFSIESSTVPIVIGSSAWSRSASLPRYTVHIVVGLLPTGLWPRPGVPAAVWLVSGS